MKFLYPLALLVFLFGCAVNEPATDRPTKEVAGAVRELTRPEVRYYMIADT